MVKLTTEERKQKTEARIREKAQAAARFPEAGLSHYGEQYGVSVELQARDELYLRVNWRTGGGPWNTQLIPLEDAVELSRLIAALCARLRSMVEQMNGYVEQINATRALAPLPGLPIKEK